MSSILIGVSRRTSTPSITRRSVSWIDPRFAAVFDWFVAAARRRRDQLRGRRLSVS
jgi:hypothetical protein